MRAQRVAVRADELALLDFVEDPLTTAAPSKQAEVRLLLKARKVIPMHRGRVERLTAIRARPSRLEADVPRDELGLPTLVLLLSSFPVGLVVRCRIFPTARLAPRLMAVTRRRVKRRNRVRLTTAVTLLRLRRASRTC